jgi:hypothetical protein
MLARPWQAVSATFIQNSAQPVETSTNKRIVRDNIVVTEKILKKDFCQDLLLFKLTELLQTRQS